MFSSLFVTVARYEMEVIMKKIILLTFLCIALTLNGCVNGTGSSQTKVSPSPTVTEDGVPIEHVSATYVIDLSDPVVAAAEADYVFVGKVNSIADERQLFGEFSIPYTFFSVTVLQNMKGDLITDEPIEVFQSGGYDSGRERYVMMGDEPLAEVGGIYIMMANTQIDGTLFVSGANSCVAIENLPVDAQQDIIIDKIKKDKTYKRYLTATAKSKTKVKSHGKGNVLSKYDINPDEPTNGELTYQDFAEQSEIITESSGELTYQDFVEESETLETLSDQDSVVEN
jgi:hypothetical protein